MPSGPEPKSYHVELSMILKGRGYLDDFDRPYGDLTRLLYQMATHHSWLGASPDTGAEQCYPA